MDIRSLRSPERKYFQNIARSYRGETLQRLLYRGVIQNVDKLGNLERPRFSIQAKILGIDGPTEKTDGRWFPPLFPIHQIAIPEVGEEVLLICEEIGNINTAFWISRTTTANTLTYNEIGAGIRDQLTDRQESSSYYGHDGKPPTEPNDKVPEQQYDIPDPRVKPGDVLTQGRSNTFTRHTFETKNGTGYVETVTEEQPVPDSDFYKDDFRKSEGTRTVQVTTADLDTLILDKINNLQFHPNFLKGTTGDGIDSAERAKNKYDTAYLLLEALELRLISREGKQIQHAVLAEQQELWLIALINIIKQLIVDLKTHVDNVKTFSQQVALHKHTSPTGITGPPLGPELLKFQTEIPVNLFENGDKKNFTTDSDSFEEHKSVIPEHHSKKVAIN